MRRNECSPGLGTGAARTKGRVMTVRREMGRIFVDWG